MRRRRKKEEKEEGEEEEEEEEEDNAPLLNSKSIFLGTFAWGVVSHGSPGSLFSNIY